MNTELDICVNGEPRRARAGCTIAELLAELGITGGKVAVERNREIAPRSIWDATALADGDRIEIVQFVGGG